MEAEKGRSEEQNGRQNVVNRKARMNIKAKKKRKRKKQRKNKP
jgi:hypothetical protein